MFNFKTNNDGTRWLGKFCFLGKVFKNFQASSTRFFITKCTDFKNQCWPMVKISPEIINFLGFFCPEKVKYYPKYKSAQFLLKLYPKTQNLAQSPSPTIITLTATQPDPNNGHSMGAGYQVEFTSANPRPSQMADAGTSSPVSLGRNPIIWQDFCMNAVWKREKLDHEVGGCT